MSFSKLKSWAKINLSLNVIKRLPTDYHKIESLITFAQLSDEINSTMDDVEISKFVQGLKNFKKISMDLKRC